MINYIAIALPVFITIIGFIVNYVMLQRSFRNEITKEKSRIHLEKLAEMPLAILEMMDAIIFSTKESTKNGKQLPKDFTKNFHNTMSKIYAYGTNDSIRIGHERVQTTMDTYGHLYPSKQIEVANKLNLLMETDADF